MLSTSLGIQFNINDLESSYEVVGSSDNYSFQYELGRGYDLVDFEGETFQRSVSLEGNYGEFDVRVFAVNDVGIRSAFIETGIDISAPEFKGTFTFNNLRVNNLPANSNVGAVNTHEPLFQGDSLSVKSEYINKNAEISWELIPPPGHFKEGQSLREELLSDRFFDKFEITLRNGTTSQLIDDSVLSSSPSLAKVLSSSDINETFSNYRAFSIDRTLTWIELLIFRLYLTTLLVEPAPAQSPESTISLSLNLFRIILEAQTFRFLGYLVILIID